MSSIAIISVSVSILALVFGITKYILKVRSSRPRLKVEIISSRPDNQNSRWIFRAKVVNISKVTSKKCEGFWSIFDSKYQNLESGVSVFWTPELDNNYDYKKRSQKVRDLEPHETAYCWIEISIESHPVEGKYYLFPYDTKPGMFYMAVVLIYGQFKSFDFLGLNITSIIDRSDDFAGVSGKIEPSWTTRKGLYGLIRRCFLNKFIRSCDYHNYIRPT